MSTGVWLPASSTCVLPSEVFPPILLSLRDQTNSVITALVEANSPRQGKAITQEGITQWLKGIFLLCPTL